MPKINPLSTEQLYRRCDPRQFSFKSTAELSELDNSLGQERATEAIQFGIGIKHPGYNLFAFGAQGMGKYSTVRRHLEEKAADEEIPSDWCYVNNFDEAYKPRVLMLPPGKGVALRDDMERFADELKVALSSAFESDDYRARKHALEEQFKQRHEKVFNEFQQRVNKENVALIRTPMGLTLAPLDRGEVVSAEVFAKWPEEHRKTIQEKIAKFEKELQEFVHQVPKWEREHRDDLRKLNHETTSFAVGHLIDDLRSGYKDLPEVLEFLETVQADVVANADELMNQEQSDADIRSGAAMRQLMAVPLMLRRYLVNVVANQRGAESLPVVYEDHPTMPNLFGKIEHMSQFGTLITDFSLIKPGALHAANGGYLILEARKVLMQPFVWEELKRALKSRELHIQNVGEMLGLVSTVSLEPQPIPLDIKVVLFGDRLIYYLLSQLDPDFVELFKVAADFEDEFERNDHNDQLYAQLIAGITRTENLRALEPKAVARVIEEASRLASDAERVSLQIRPISDLLREADFYAQSQKNGLISAKDIQKAIDAKTYRVDRIRSRSQEQIERGTILIDTEGEAVGQVNALSVLQLGDFSFGRPSRITASVRVGKGEVVDIEREVALGGPLHSKGILILTGFLGERFGSAQPLALSASVVFEQSYGGVDGDSASSAELYALLSALSGVPINQSFAVTGSVNQHGQVQAIGGVNEKIEGFFDICNKRGLTGKQGVLIPSSNKPHLMLRNDVVAAAEKGKFHIFAIDSIDQGIELLTNIEAGVLNENNQYTAGTVNQLVAARLAEFAAHAKRFTSSEANDSETKH